MSSRLGVVVPSFIDGGGVPQLARFLVNVAIEAGDYDVEIVSLPVSSSDPLGRRVLRPRTWTRPLQVREEKWGGVRLLHAGAAWVEFEFQRYRRRPELDRILARYDLIQVVCGSPAFANVAVGLGVPVSLQTATLARVERRRRDAVSGAGLGTWRQLMTRIASRLEERALLSVDAIQVMNGWMDDHVRRINGGRAVDIRLAPPGVDAERFAPADDRWDKARRPYVLCVGRLDDPRKNIEMLARAFAHLAKELPGVDLVTAGSSSPPTRFWDLVRGAGLEPRVRHVSSPTTDNLVSLYQHAAAFALPSDEEGLGIVLLEAMACGVPVVATRCGGPETFVRDGGNGFLVDLDDAQGMADRLSLVVKDEGLNRRMGQEARRTIETRYARDVAAKAFLDVWDRLLAKSVT